MDVLYGLIIALSFFTIIPMPFIEWTPGRTKWMPFFIPVVGCVVGGGSVILFRLLNSLELNSVFQAILMVAYYLIITGGVHTDGLMDSGDGYFSRRSIERKLEIMTDSRVGAFAVMTFVLVFVLKIGAFVQLFEAEYFDAYILLYVSILARFFQPSMLFLFPFAKNDGLAQMYGTGLRKKHGVILLAVASLLAISMVFVCESRYLVIIPIVVLYYVFFYYSSKKQFGGVTGDLLGAFLEVSELLMLIGLAVVSR